MGLIGIARIPFEDRGADVARNAGFYPSEEAAARHYETGDLFLAFHDDTDQADDVTRNVEAILEREQEQIERWTQEHSAHIAAERAYLRVA